jgi:hypothetical protein
MRLPLSSKKLARAFGILFTLDGSPDDEGGGGGGQQQQQQEQDEEDYVYGGDDFETESD